MGKTLLGTTKEGEEIYAYTLKNKNGMEADIMTYGANLLGLRIPAGSGAVDVTTGLESLSSYFNNSSFHGCVVARVANRIGKAAFDLDGVHYELDKNDGNNNLHSGFNPLCKRIYKVDEADDTHIKLSIESPDMDMGFPGKMEFSVTYTLSDDDALIFDYEAVSDKNTLFNPTTHTYFNLLGHDHGTILKHKLYINSKEVTYADSESIPDGTIREVTGTPMDFTSPKEIGLDIDTDYDLLNFGKGYDHNYILNKDSDSVSKEFSTDDLTVTHAATLFAPDSDRKMDVYTDLPGIQFYSANFFDGKDVAKGGANYGRRCAIALETQFYPNAINIPSFPQPVIKAGEKKHTRTVYKFSGF